MSNKETNSKIVYEAFLNTDDPSKDKIDLFYDTLPENAEKEYSEIYKNQLSAWKPTAYTVEVDSPIHMSEVLKQLNEMGLKVPVIPMQIIMRFLKVQKVYKGCYNGLL